jgi:hypothetical protein
VLDNLGNPVHRSVIKTPRGLPDHDSVDLICEEFFERCAPFLEKPEGQSVTRVYVELVIFGKTGKATGRAEATGVLKWNLRQDGHMIYGVEPKALNSFFANRFGFKYPRNTKEIKEATKEMVHRHFGLYTNDDNQADAEVAARFGYAHTFEKQRLSPTALSRVF